MFRSLRLQLAAWYVAFFSLLFVLFGIFLYSVLSRALETRLEATLASEASTAAALMADELMEEKGDAAKAATEVTSELRGSVVAILWDGRVLAASAAFFPGGFEAAALQAAGQPSADIPLDMPRTGPHGSRAAAHRLVQDGREFLIVAVAPLDSVAADLALVQRRSEEHT